MRDIKPPGKKAASPRTFEEQLRERTEEMKEKAGAVFAELPLGGEDADAHGAPANSRKKPVALMAVVLVLVFAVASLAWWYENAMGKLDALRAIAEKADAGLPLFSKTDPGENGFPGTVFEKLDALKLLREIPTFYRVISELSVAAGNISNAVTVFEGNFPDILFGRGDVLLVDLAKTVRKSLGNIGMLSADILSRDSALKTYLPQLQNYVSWNGHLSRAKQFLDGAISILESGPPRHILIVFQNSSEIRPTGGFWGSFADARISDGRVEAITVYDINELDRTDSRKIVPPKPLQAVVSRWRAADANWFFSYPDSARKFSEFASASALFGEASTTVDAVVAVSPRLVGDILALTGPVEVSSGTTITGENFLPSIQEEVQEGQARKSQEPKQILKKLLPALLDRIGALPDREKIFAHVPEWIEKKDIMVWMKDPSMANVLAYYHADGGLFSIPVNFYGDYLAVVPANIGGAKTDLFIDQAVKLESSIDEIGVLTDHLEISRSHRGNTATQWWYREPNQAYIRIFTPQNARLSGATGGFKKQITPKVSYGSYEKDSDVVALEATRETLPDFPLVEKLFESSKNVFALWTRVERGKTANATLDYSRRLPGIPVAGGIYTFVLETQPGVKSSYHISITAPAGFIWKETGSPTYEYENQDPPGQSVFVLTFEKT